MPRAGRPRTPTAIKVLRGETRPSRINPYEPQPVERLPQAPPDMGDAAVRVWDRILGDFGHTGVIRRLDTDVLRIYCDAVVRYGEASRLLESSGPLIRGRDGALVRNPLNQVVRDQAKLVQSLAGELGLTPAARTGLTWQQAPASQGSALSRARERRLRSVG